VEVSRGSLPNGTCIDRWTKGSGRERVGWCGDGATCRHASLGRHAVDIGFYSLDVEQGKCKSTHRENTERKPYRVKKNHIVLKKPYKVYLWYYMQIKIKICIVVEALDLKNKNQLLKIII